MYFDKFDIFVEIVAIGKCKCKMKMLILIITQIYVFKDYNSSKISDCTFKCFLVGRVISEILSCYEGASKARWVPKYLKSCKYFPLFSTFNVALSHN